MNNRLIDTLIAINVFGFREMPNEFDHDSTFICPDLRELWLYEIPHYSTQIQDAWLVVEKTREKDYSLSVLTYLKGSIMGGEYTVKFFNGSNEDGFIGYADTAPMAICKAALKALGVGIFPADIVFKEVKE